MMSEALGISVDAWRKWVRRHTRTEASSNRRRGRPSGMPNPIRQAIRCCYQKHFGQWGPLVLASWARREGLGRFSPGTIERVIADIRIPVDPAPKPLRYEITASNVLWAEDGAAFRTPGRKRELLVLQDDHARFRVNHRLVDGPARAEDVASYLEEAFLCHGVPLVLKHDGGKIFHAKPVRDLLDRYQVTELTGPPHYPQYNGKKERSFRDLRSFVRAMAKATPATSLAERIDAAIHDLNNDRPRPVLSGRTAAEVYRRDQVTLPDRAQFKQEVDTTTALFMAEAASREQKERAGRRAVEAVLSRYGYLEISGGDVNRFPDRKRE